MLHVKICLQVLLKFPIIKSILIFTCKQFDKVLRQNIINLRFKKKKKFDKYRLTKYRSLKHLTKYLFIDNSNYVSSDDKHNNNPTRVKLL